MKIIKNVVSVLSFVVLLTASSDLSANHNPTEDWKSQLIEYLSDWNYTESNNMPEKILVDFMINEKAEIIVLSISNKSFDKSIKSLLNYKKLSSQSLKTFEKYTLPIVFEKG